MTFAQKHAAEKVTSVDEDPFIGGWRCGTVEARKFALITLFGEPQRVFDEKVTMRWVFKTPRGFAEVRDYWWNGPTEWSIAAANQRAADWTIRFLQAKGLKAHSKMTAETA